MFLSKAWSPQQEKQAAEREGLDGEVLRLGAAGVREGGSRRGLDQQLACHTAGFRRHTENNSWDIAPPCPCLPRLWMMSPLDTMTCTGVRVALLGDTSPDPFRHRAGRVTTSIFAEEHS